LVKWWVDETKSPPIVFGEDWDFASGQSADGLACAGLKKKLPGNVSLIGWVGALRPADPTSIALLAREQKPGVGRRRADESESEMVGVLPGHLADQRTVLASLGCECQNSVCEG
jgi:hypothetical protein